MTGSVYAAFDTKTSWVNLFVHILVMLAKSLDVSAGKIQTIEWMTSAARNKCYGNVRDSTKRRQYEEKIS